MLHTPSVAPPVSRIALGAVTPQVNVAVKEAPLVVSIEGNIGVGKSTLLGALKERYAKDETVCFVDEPVATWEQHGLLAASKLGPAACLLWSLPRASLSPLVVRCARLLLLHSPLCAKEAIALACPWRSVLGADQQGRLPVHGARHALLRDAPRAAEGWRAARDLRAQRLVGQAHIRRGQPV
eukprot:1674070-Prymnesium_polylepis.1